MVARDWRGKLVFAYSKRVDTNIPVQAEAKAIFWALHLAKKVDASHFVIESDSKICTDAISTGGDHVPWRLSNFIENAQVICVDFGSVSFKWVYLEANKAAHELAKWSESHGYFGSFGVGLCPPHVVQCS